MQRSANPYRPGFNQAPLVLAGRDDVLDGAREALEVAALDGRTPRPLALLGARGVGKTVTLREIAAHAAQSYAWPTIHVEVATGGALSVELLSGLQYVERLFRGEQPESDQMGAGNRRGRGVRVVGGKVGAQVLGIGGEVSLAVPPAAGFETSAPSTLPSRGSLSEALAATMRAAAAAGTPATGRATSEAGDSGGAGLVVTLDELQNADTAELGILGTVLQQAMPEDWPLVVAIAALPSLRTTRGPRRLPTYLERAEWHALGSLTDEQAYQALAGPAEDAGRPISVEAVAALLRIAGGYPYAVQVAGHYAWRASTGASSIEVEHVDAAAPRVRADLDQLFAGRWDDASGREREYLVAMSRVTSRDEQPPNGGAVARELGVAPQSVSYVRDRLIKKGTVFRDGAGGMHFVAPGMTEWVLREHADDYSPRGQPERSPRRGRS